MTRREEINYEFSIKFFISFICVQNSDQDFTGYLHQNSYETKSLLYNETIRKIYSFRNEHWK